MPDPTAAETFVTGDEYLGFVPRIIKHRRRPLAENDRSSGSDTSGTEPFMSNDLFRQRIFPDSYSGLWQRYINEGVQVKGIMADNVLYWTAMEHGSTSHGDISKSAGLNGLLTDTVSFSLWSDREGNSNLPRFQIDSVSRHGKKLSGLLLRYFKNSLLHSDDYILDLRIPDETKTDTIEYYGPIGGYSPH